MLPRTCWVHLHVPVHSVQQVQPTCSLAPFVIGSASHTPHTLHTFSQVSQELKLLISMVCSNLKVDGIRGDIVATRSSRALAALEGRDEVRRWRGGGRGGFYPYVCQEGGKGWGRQL